MATSIGKDRKSVKIHAESRTKRTLLAIDLLGRMDVLLTHADTDKIIGVVEGKWEQCKLRLRSNSATQDFKLDGEGGE